MNLVYFKKEKNQYLFRKNLSLDQVQGITTLRFAAPRTAIFFVLLNK